MFGGKSKEENKKELAGEFAEKYDLTDLIGNPAIEDLAVKLSQPDLLNLTAAFSGNQPDRVKITYLSAISEQNLVIMGQLAQLNKNIERLLSK